MKVFASSVDVASAEFGSNYEAMGVLVAELERRLEEGQWQGEERTTRRFAAEGKLLARERIELLLDDDAPYLEICALAGWGQEVDTREAKERRRKKKEERRKKKEERRKKQTKKERKKKEEKEEEEKNKERKKEKKAVF